MVARTVKGSTLNRGLNVKDNPFLATGDAVTDDFTAINAANTAATATGTIHFGEGTYVIGTNLTLTALCTFDKGAKLKPSSGIVVTMTGGLGADSFEIFDSTSNGTFDISGMDVEDVNIRWFGILGDGTDEGAAMNSALTACGNDRTIEFPPAVYGTSIDIIPLGGQKLVGNGTARFEGSTAGSNFVATANSFTSALIVMPSLGAEVTGFKFDGVSLCPSAIQMVGNKDIVDSNQFTGFLSDFIISTGTGAGNFIIENNDFFEGAVGQGFINLIEGRGYIITRNIFRTPVSPNGVMAFIVQVQGSTEDGTGTLTANRVNGQTQTAASGYIDGFIIDNDNVMVTDNLFSIDSGNTSFLSHIRVKAGADNCTIINGQYVGQGSAGRRVVIESGATGTTIIGSNIAWNDSTGISTAMTDNGDNTLISFGTVTALERIMSMTSISFVDPSGGEGLSFNPLLAKITFERDVDSLDFIGTISGEMAVSSRADMLLLAPTGSAVKSLVNFVEEFNVDGNRVDDQTNLTLRTDSGGFAQRIRVGEEGTGSQGVGRALYVSTVSTRIEATNAQFNDVSDIVNTIGKFAGRTVLNSDITHVIFANGPLAADTWADADGVVTNSPV